MLLTKVCQALNRTKIKYAVVGGYALALHGAVRSTVDLDFVIQLKEKAFLELEGVFEKLGFESRLPVRAEQVFRFREEYIQNRNLIAWSFYNPKAPAQQLDVLINIGVDEIDTQMMTIYGVKVRVASIESMIEMKKRAGRPQDLEDVKALRELLKK